MRCEVCGAEIKGQPYYRIIEGGRMTVCGRCAKYGSSDWDPSVTQVRQGNRPASPRRPRSEFEAAETQELVENYGEKIRKARQAKKLTVEDFARMIREKESVVKNLEREELNPDSKLVRKIRNALSIEILERGETASASMQVASKPAGGRTFGDLMKLTQKSDEEDEEE